MPPEVWDFFSVTKTVQTNRVCSFRAIVNTMSKIIFDNPSGVFYPDQVVSGKFVFVARDEITVKAITLIFKGFANVSWTECYGTGVRHYRSYEKYFHDKKCIFGKDHTWENSTRFKAGQYSFPFRVQLPSNLPSSYESEFGQVRYSIKAHVGTLWASDKYTKRMITIVNLLDLNTIPAAKNEVSNSYEKTFCCCCCESGPISATVTVDRMGYVPGEDICFKGEVNNQSGTTMENTKAKLIMKVTYHVAGDTKQVKHILAELKHGKLEHGETDIWMNEKLHIPPVPPSYMPGCNIINIEYFVKLVAKPSSRALRFNVAVELVIGSIPLASVSAQHGLSLPTSVQLSVPVPKIGAPKSNNTDTSMPTNIRQATMSESAMGRVTIKEGKEGTGTVDYAPVYPYYKWDQPDANTMFGVQR